MVRELFTIKVETPENELISLDSLEAVISRISKFLDSMVENKFSGKNAVWGFTRVTMNSPLNFGVGIKRSAKGVFAPVLRRSTIHGFTQLKKDETIPSDWSPANLERGGALCQLVDRKEIDKLEIRNGHKSVSLSAIMLSTINAKGAIEHLAADSIGSIDGRLELIDIHEGFRVGIRRDYDNHFVSAKLPDEGPPKRAVLDLLGKRVHADGTVKWRRDGRPREIIVDQLVPVIVDEAVDILDLWGSDPNITDGLTVDEFLRRQRGD